MTLRGAFEHNLECRWLRWSLKWMS